MTPGRRRTSLRVLLRKIQCYVFRHLAPHPIGTLHRVGFQPAPVYQCPRCQEVFMQFRAVKRLGGRPVT